MRAPAALDPTSNVAVMGVTLRPVNHSALRVPLVHAIERNTVAHREARDPGCQIDIVCD